MNYDYVRIEKEGAIALVRFEREANLNAFDQKLLIELTEAAKSFHDDMTTRAVILTGRADVFSAGFDLKAAAARDEEKMTDTERRHIYYRGVRLCRAWEAMPQITIAAIEGACVGGGVALAIALDWRVMSEKAYLYVPEVRVGLNLQWGALPRLIALVGPARAKRVCILCERMSAPQAKEWGLIEEIAPKGGAVQEAGRLAEMVAEMPAMPTQIVKEAVNATSGALYGAASFADADQSQLTSRADDARTARTRFAARRKSA